MTTLYDKFEEILKTTDFSKKLVKLKVKKSDVEKAWMDATRGDPPDFDFN